MLPARGTFSRQFKVAVTTMLAIAAGALFWTHATTGSSVVTAIHAQSSPAISPTELMLKGSEKLQVENWDAF